MSDRKYKIFTLIAMLALCSHGSGNEPTDTPDSCAAAPEEIRSDRLETLSKQLEIASHARNARATQLRRIRKQVRDSSEPGERLIDSHAFILQVASYIASGNYDTARMQLRGISLSHPKAVTAGLLMAESYRLEGDTDTAKDWFLRIANSFPHHPEAQQGLLSAALDAQHAGQLPLARALLEHSASLAEASAHLASALTKDSEREKADLLFNSPSDIPDTIYRQFLQTLFDQRPEIAALVAELRHTRQQHGCIKARWHETQEQQKTLSESLDQFREQRASVIAAIELRRDSLETLKQEVKAGNLDNAQVELRKRIRRQENLLRREKLALVAVDQNIDAVEQMADAAARELGQIKTLFRERWRQDMDAILTAIDVSAARVIGTYRNIAGEAHYYHAELGR